MNYIKVKYDCSANLLLTYTDSLVFGIENDNFYEDFCRNKKFFDFSNYPKDLQFFHLFERRQLVTWKMNLGEML